MTTNNAPLATETDKQRAALGHDESGYDYLMGQFIPAPTEDMHKKLSWAAKGYWMSDSAHATAEPIEGLYPLTLERRTVPDPNKPAGHQDIAHEQIVPVFMFSNADRTMGVHILIHRTHRERSFRLGQDGKPMADENGKYRYWDTYDCGFLTFPDPDSARDFLFQVRNQVEFSVARAIGGTNLTERKAKPVGADDVDIAVVELAGQHQTARPARKSTKSTKK